MMDVVFKGFSLNWNPEWAAHDGRVDLVMPGKKKAISLFAEWSVTTLHDFARAIADASGIGVQASAVAGTCLERV